MTFNHSFMPDVAVSEMRGIMSLLHLIANSESKTALDFLTKLSSEKDAAIEAAKQAAADRAKTEELARELTGMQAREASLTERERVLAEAQTAHDRRVADFNARVQAMATALTGAKQVMSG